MTPAEKQYQTQTVPQSRIATFDVGAISKTKHQVAALLELDVTDARLKLRQLKSAGERLSFTAWLISVIASTLNNHREAAGYLSGKRKLFLFDHVNMSIVVEKDVGNKKVPIPLVIEKCEQKSAQDITAEIRAAKEKSFSETDVVLHRKPSVAEKIYYYLPGFLRRLIWRFMLSHPKIAYKNMGNAVLTSIGMMGRFNGWFLHTSIHPISFGIGSIIKKPWVVEGEIQIREILNMTILLDHNVIDGAPMARFISDLTRGIENGAGLEPAEREQHSE